MKLADVIKNLPKEKPTEWDEIFVTKVWSFGKLKDYLVETPLRVEQNYPEVGWWLAKNDYVFFDRLRRYGDKTIVGQSGGYKNIEDVVDEFTEVFDQVLTVWKINIARAKQSEQYKNELSFSFQTLYILVSTKGFVVVDENGDPKVFNLGTEINAKDFWV